MKLKFSEFKFYTCKRCFWCRKLCWIRQWSNFCRILLLSLKKIQVLLV